MTHSLRPLAAGLTYHVTTRGNEQRALFRDDVDRRRLLALLGRVVIALRWSLESFCLMPNHLHLLVRTPEPDLSDGLRDCLSRYAIGFNERHERCGHLFGARFHSVVVTRDAHHFELFRYFALNPVRARLCPRPEAFAWSAHAAHLGLVAPPPFLDMSLGPFAGDRERLAAFVGAARPTYLEDLLGDGSIERLRLAAAAGSTQVEIAQALGLSRSTLQRRLRDAKSP